MVSIVVVVESILLNSREGILKSKQILLGDFLFNFNFINFKIALFSKCAFLMFVAKILFVILSKAKEKTGEFQNGWKISFLVII
jgi:general stress protein CsbA